MAPVLQRTATWMVIVSVVSAFFLQTIEFPVGGVFGRAVAMWLQNFLDIAGTLALLLFALLASFVFNNNPNLDDFTWHKLLYETRQAWRDLLNGNYGKRRPVAAPPPRNRTRSVPAEETEAELPELELPIQTPEAAPGSQMSFDLTKRSALFEDGGPGDKKTARRTRAGGQSPTQRTLRPYPRTLALRVPPPPTAQRIRPANP
jgi:hypothetical protein